MAARMSARIEWYWRVRSRVGMAWASVLAGGGIAVDL
jgi:hypothetical protein